MKKSLVVFCFAALLFAACGKENTVEAEEGNCTLTVSLADDTKASGTPTQAQENFIKTYNIYVFTNNKLEVVKTFTSGLNQTISGLRPGNKIVYVLANAPSSFPVLVKGDPYTKLADQSAYINLDTQTDITNGLTMSGESVVNVAPYPSSNNVHVQIKRLVAKVKLGTVTIGNKGTHTFALKKVLITKARSLSSIDAPTIITKPPYFGGVAGISSPPVVDLGNVKSYLAENITDADNANRYFYVFGNDNSDGNSTLIVLQAEIDGKTMYYPVEINNATTGNGQYVVRNTQYTVNITISDLDLGGGGGTIDPENPNFGVNLGIVIEPQNWAVSPTQNVIF